MSERIQVMEQEDKTSTMATVATHRSALPTVVQASQDLDEEDTWHDVVAERPEGWRQWMKTLRYFWDKSTAWSRVVLTSECAATILKTVADASCKQGYWSEVLSPMPSTHAACPRIFPEPDCLSRLLVLWPNAITVESKSLEWELCHFALMTQPETTTTTMAITTTSIYNIDDGTLTDMDIAAVLRFIVSGLVTPRLSELSRTAAHYAHEYIVNRPRGTCAAWCLRPVCKKMND